VVPIEFRGPSTQVLRGLMFGSGERWVILVHGEGQDLDAWRPLTRLLAGRELRIMAFDLPGHGASDAEWDPGLAAASVMAAMDFARSAGARQIHLVGAKIGALTVLAAGAHEDYQPDSIVALSPTVDERVAALPALREARAPKLILVGSLDPDSLEAAQVVYRGAIGRCELTQFPVSSQGTELLAGDWGPHAREKVLAHVMREG
jgi:alpha-beta hydrolase superfamily lysophospholipase